MAGRDTMAVVTGGTKGIGRSIALRFIREGYHVAVCSRKQEDLDQMEAEVKEMFGVQLSTLACDLSKKAEVEAFSEWVKSKDKEISVLVNNAGRFLPGTVGEEEEGTFEAMIDTNLSSAYHLTRRLLPVLKQNRSGHIFNICSTASIMAYTNGGSYCISKFALYGMSKVLREELKEYGIRVTSVLPGATYTASWEGADLPEERLMPPEDVAEMIWSTYSLSSRSVVEDLLIRPQLGDL